MLADSTVRSSWLTLAHPRWYHCLHFPSQKMASCLPSVISLRYTAQLIILELASSRGLLLTEVEACFASSAVLLECKPFGVSGPRKACFPVLVFLREDLSPQSVVPWAFCYYPQFSDTARRTVVHRGTRYQTTSHALDSSVLYWIASLL